MMNRRPPPLARELPGFYGPVTAVAALHTLPQVVLAGTGPWVLALDVSTARPLGWAKALEWENVHGLVSSRRTFPGDRERVFVHGVKQAAIVSVSAETGITVEHRFPVLADRVHHAAWLAGPSTHPANLALIFTHNFLQLWTVEQSGVACRQQWTSEVHCTLCGSQLRGASVARISAICGTVFGSILIWSVDGMEAATDGCKRPREETSNVPVRASLQGHVGLVFAVDLSDDRRLLASGSDDRTVRLWDTSAVFDSSWKLGSVLTPLHTMFGHTARVWKVVLQGDFVISAGEDAVCRVWSRAGEPLHALPGHAGRNIWALAAHPTHAAVITGGADGSVRVHSVHAADVLTQHTRTREVSVPAEENDFPRAVSLIDTDRAALVMHSGSVVCVHLESDEFRILSPPNAHFSGYGLLATNTSAHFLAVGSLTGWVQIVGLAAVPVQLLFQAHKIKVQYLAWCSAPDFQNDLFTSTQTGEVKWWRCSQPEDKVHVALLATFSTEAKGFVQAFALFPQLKVLACGDRSGAVHLFDWEGKLPRQTIAAHGKKSVTDLLAAADDEVLSVGRNGYCCSFRISRSDAQFEHELLLSRKVQTGIDWMERILSTDRGLFLMYFRKNMLHLVDFETAAKVISLETPGGHSPWDFRCGAQFPQDYTFASIASRKLSAILSPPVGAGPARFSMQPCLRPGLHGKHISCAVALPFPLAPEQKEWIIISGGEDTRMYMTLYNADQNKLHSPAVVAGQVTTLRALALAASQWRGPSRTQMLAYRALGPWSWGWGGRRTSPNHSCSGLAASSAACAHPRLSGYGCVRCVQSGRRARLGRGPLRCSVAIDCVFGRQKAILFAQRAYFSSAVCAVCRVGGTGWAACGADCCH
eukprot:m.273954 g.273954  ORF g.273954 m.273954 type:complete len:872 (+) comp22854_c0_seq1:3-2618(+)